MSANPERLLRLASSFHGWSLVHAKKPAYIRGQRSQHCVRVYNGSCADIHQRTHVRSRRPFSSGEWIDELYGVLDWAQSEGGSSRMRTQFPRERSLGHRVVLVVQVYVGPAFSIYASLGHFSFRSKRKHLRGCPKGRTRLLGQAMKSTHARDQDLGIVSHLKLPVLVSGLSSTAEPVCVIYMHEWSIVPIPHNICTWAISRVSGQSEASPWCEGRRRLTILEIAAEKSSINLDRLLSRLWKVQVTSIVGP